jgi:hypothetical protein
MPGPSSGTVLARSREGPRALRDILYDDEGDHDKRHSSGHSALSSYPAIVYAAREFG